MSAQFSRRNFLSLTTTSAAAAIVASTFKPVLSWPSKYSGADQQNSSIAPAFGRLDEFIAHHLSATGAPGLTLAIANREGLLRTATYGFADSKAAKRVAPENLFEIGSISKSFVALVILQLFEEGKLDLQKPVVQYLPWLRINSKFEPITPHHLLSHTAGLPEAPLSLDALLDELPTGYAPGKRFLYANTGYNVLGFLIEAVDKRPFGEAIRKRLLEPLGMTATVPVITNDVRAQMAVGYGPLKPDRPFPLLGPLAEAPWIEMDMAAGSIASTPADMAKYVRLLLNRGALSNVRILRPETFDLFTKPVVKAPFRGEDASYAYGLWVSENSGHTHLRHTGGMVAFSSSIDADVTSGVGAFASVNANLRGYRPVVVTRYAIDLINASIAGKPLPDPPASPPSPWIIKNASDYIGVFTSPSGRRLEFVAEGEKLLLLSEGAKVALEQAGKDLFIVKHPAFETFLLGFTRDKDQVTEAFHGADWFPGAKYSGPREWDVPKEWNGYVGHYHSDSPWYGDTRIVMRKGRLYSDGVQLLVPGSEGKFGFGEEGPDWVSFDSIVNGRAMRLNLSGIPFTRIFTA